jgi:intracellular sulfur oxidation DsrE/DsrF family protein
MEERMINLSPDTAHAAPRRSLFGRLAGAAALGLAGLLPTPSSAETATPGSDGSRWPGKLKGRHRQVVDAYDISGGFPLGFAYTFVATSAPPGSATSVVILRHAAFPIALNSEMWRKYKIVESLKIVDPETNAPAVKNPFLHPKPGVLMVDDMAVDRLLEKGTIFGACNVALTGLSKKLASNAGVSAGDAAKEWTANVVPGITIVPSGVWGLNRAQEAGCTYCAGG